MGAVLFIRGLYKVVMRFKRNLEIIVFCWGGLASKKQFTTSWGTGLQEKLYLWGWRVLEEHMFLKFGWPCQGQLSRNMSKLKIKDFNLGGGSIA